VILIGSCFSGYNLNPERVLQLVDYISLEDLQLESAQGREDPPSAGSGASTPSPHFWHFTRDQPRLHMCKILPNELAADNSGQHLASPVAVLAWKCPSFNFRTKSRKKKTTLLSLLRVLNSFSAIRWGPLSSKTTFALCTTSRCTLCSHGRQACSSYR